MPDIKKGTKLSCKLGASQITDNRVGQLHDNAARAEAVYEVMRTLCDHISCMPDELAQTTVYQVVCELQSLAAKVTDKEVCDD